MSKLKDSLGGIGAVFLDILEPAQEFMRTGKLSAAAWAGVKGVLTAKVLGPISMATGAAIGFLGAMKAVVAQTELLGKGMSKLRELEMVKTQFQPLLGGATQAQARLDELYAFAARTPFQLVEIAEASKTLEVLTRGAISTGESLKMIGDAAAVSGQSMQSVAFWTGRLYDSLQAGRPIGEAANRLMEMGLITGKTRAKVEAMNTAGVEFNQVWAVVTQGMEKTKGGMENLSKTLGGLESTLVDVRGAFEKSFADAFKEGEIKSVKNSIELLAATAGPIEDLGKNLAFIPNMLTNISGFFIKLAKDVGFLDGGLKFLINTFTALGGGLIIAQLAHSTRAILGMGKAVQTAANTTAVANAWASNSTLGFRAQVKAVTVELGQMNIAQRITTVGMFTLGGAAQAAGGILGYLRAMIIGVATSLGTVGWAILALSGGWMIFSRISEEAKKNKEAVNAAASSYKEFKKTLDDAIGSMKTFADKQSAIAKIQKEISSTQTKIEGLVFDVSVNEKLGKGNVLQAERDKLAKLYEDMASTLAIDSSSLELSKAKSDELEKQLELVKAIQDVEFRSMMRDGDEAGRLYAIQRKRDQIDQAKRAGEAAVAGKSNVESFNQREDVITRRSEIKGLGDLIKTLEAASTEAEGQRNGLIAAAFDALTSGVFDTTKNSRIDRLIESNVTDISAYKSILDSMEAEDVRERNRAFGFLSQKAVEEISEEGFQVGQSFDGSNMRNPYVVIRNTILANADESLGFKLNPRQLERLQLALKKYGEFGDSLNSNRKSLLQLDDELSVQDRNLWKAISIEAAARNRFSSELNIDPLAPGAEMKRMDAAIKEKRAQLIAEQNFGDKSEQRRKLDSDLKALEEERDHSRRIKEGFRKEHPGMSEHALDLAYGAELDAGHSVYQAFTREGKKGETFEQYIQRRIDAINEAMTASDELDGIGSLRRELARLEKSREDYKNKLAQDFDILRKQIDAEKDKLSASKLISNMRSRASLDIDMGAAVGDAMSLLVSAGEKELEANQKRKEIDYKSKYGEKQAAALIALDKDQNQNRAQAALSQYFSEGEVISRKSELEFGKRMNYSQSSKDMRKLDNVLLVVGEMDKVGKMLAKINEADRPAFLESAQKGIQERLQASVRDSIPEFQQVADSFRRIGAGGVATGNDPTKMLAERQLEAEKQTNKILSAMLDIMDDGEQNNSWKLK